MRRTWESVAGGRIRVDLHFEVTTSSKLLAGEGVPYLIDRYPCMSANGGPIELLGSWPNRASRIGRLQVPLTAYALANMHSWATVVGPGPPYGGHLPSANSPFDWPPCPSSTFQKGRFSFQIRLKGGKGCSCLLWVNASRLGRSDPRRCGSTCDGPEITGVDSLSI